VPRGGFVLRPQGFRSAAASIFDHRANLPVRPLILREMLCGSTRFNELRMGLPRMSPALLSTKLRELEEYGMVERTTAESDRSVPPDTRWRGAPSGHHRYRRMGAPVD